MPHGVTWYSPLPSVSPANRPLGPTQAFGTSVLLEFAVAAAPCHLDSGTLWWRQPQISSDPGRCAQGANSPLFANHRARDGVGIQVNPFGSCMGVGCPLPAADPGSFAGPCTLQRPGQSVCSRLPHRHPRQELRMMAARCHQAAQFNVFIILTLSVRKNSPHQLFILKYSLHLH